MPERLPESLRDVLGKLPRMALAFSGGLDSRFLAHAANLSGCKIFAIHVSGPHLASQDTTDALNWLRQHNIPYAELVRNPLKLAEVRTNTRERCYACKRELLGAIKQEMQQKGLTAWPLCDGGNADDRHGWRPGLRAVTEAGVISPLMQAELGKMQIHAAAAATGMDRPDQKARPCLLTRFAYGLEPTEEKLTAIAACETELAKVLRRNTDFRLRLMPEPLLQISTSHGMDTATLVEILAKHGFGSAKIAACEHISGFFDQQL